MASPFLPLTATVEVLPPTDHPSPIGLDGVEQVPSGTREFHGPRTVDLPANVQGARGSLAGSAQHGASPLAPCFRPMLSIGPACEQCGGAAAAATATVDNAQALHYSVMGTLSFVLRTCISDSGLGSLGS